MKKAMTFCNISFLTSILLLCNCSILMKEAFLSEPIKVSNYELNIKPAKLTVKDERRVVDDRELKIPFFSWPGDQDEVLPVMTENHKKAIQDAFVNSLGQSGQDYEVNISLVKGIKRFDASLMYEREYVETAIRVDIFDGIHQPYLASATGESYYELKSADASNKYIEKLYQKSLITSLKKAVESIHNAVPDTKESNEPSRPMRDEI